MMLQKAETDLENHRSADVIPLKSRLSWLIDHYPLTSFFLAFWALLSAGYVVVFQVTRDESVAASLVGATINTVPVLALGLVVVFVLQSFVLSQALWRHLVAHLILATCFTFAWYFAVIVGRGFRTNWMEEGFVITPFASVAGSWQLYQGLLAYAVVALVAYAVHFQRRALAAEGSLAKELKALAETKKAEQTAERLILRSRGEFVSIDHDEICSVDSAGDDVEIQCKGRCVVASKTMVSMEATLPCPPFARLHRSYIVNLARVQSAEPAGNGRLTVHLDNGRSITTSRAGAQVFKSLVD